MENTDRLARMAKRVMRKMIGEMVYEMPSIYTSHFSRFANIFSRSRKFDDKCIAGLTSAYSSQ